MRVTKNRCVEGMGFTLHANTCAGATDDRGRDALLEYVLRPPIANEKVQQGPEGLVRIALKRPFSDLKNRNVFLIITECFVGTSRRSCASG